MCIRVRITRKNIYASVLWWFFFHSKLPHKKHSTVIHAERIYRIKKKVASCYTYFFFSCVLCVCVCARHLAKARVWGGIGEKKPQFVCYIQIKFGTITYMNGKIKYTHLSSTCVTHLAPTMRSFYGGANARVIHSLICELSENDCGAAD